VNILALDLGTRTGYASFSDNRVESGVKDFPLGRGDSPGMRFIRFNRWLVDMIALTWPALITYERPHLRGGYATDLLVGFATRVQERCAEAGIECEAVHSATLKKAATGSGRAGKDAMIAAAEERFGKSVTDDNEADALCLLWMAMKEMK